MTTPAPRRAVYRALLGGYEQLHEEEVARESDLPFICFTDDPTLTSTTWQVELVEPRLPRDSTRSARALKILGHPLLDDYDETLWVDNTVALRQPPDALFDEWLADADVAAPLHSFRRSVARRGRGRARRRSRRLRARLRAALPLPRRATARCSRPTRTGPGCWRAAAPAPPSAAMTAWWEHVLRYSRRDQLSFVPVMRRHGVRVASQPVDSHASPWHEWPVAEGRDPAGRGSGLREALRPPAARIGALQQALDDATRTLAETVGAPRRGHRPARGGRSPRLHVRCRRGRAACRRHQGRARHGAAPAQRRGAGARRRAAAGPTPPTPPPPGHRPARRRVGCGTRAALRGGIA